MDDIYRYWIAMTVIHICGAKTCEECKKVYGLTSCPKDTYTYNGRTQIMRIEFNQRVIRFIEKATKLLKTKLDINDDLPFPVDFDENDIVNILMETFASEKND